MRGRRGRPEGRLEEVFSQISLSAGSCRRDLRTKRPQLLTTLSAKWTSRFFENIFVLLAAPRSNSKSVILAGTVCKNSDELIRYGGFGKSSSDQWPAKVSLFDGRVVKNRGSRNSQAAARRSPPQPAAARGSPRQPAEVT